MKRNRSRYLFEELQRLRRLIKADSFSAYVDGKDRMIIRATKKNMRDTKSIDFTPGNICAVPLDTQIEILFKELSSGRTFFEEDEKEHPKSL